MFCIYMYASNFVNNIAVWISSNIHSRLAELRTTVMENEHVETMVFRISSWHPIISWVSDSEIVCKVKPLELHGLIQEHTINYSK